MVTVPWLGDGRCVSQHWSSCLALRVHFAALEHADSTHTQKTRMLVRGQVCVASSQQRFPPDACSLEAGEGTVWKVISTSKSLAPAGPLRENCRWCVGLG